MNGRRDAAPAGAFSGIVLYLLLFAGTVFLTRRFLGLDTGLSCLAGALCGTLPLLIAGGVRAERPGSGTGVCFAAALMLCAAETRAPGGLPDTPALWAYLLLAAPLTEEYVFRGFAQQRLEKQLGSHPAAAVCALLFALAHGEPRRAPALLAAGMLLGLCACRGGFTAAAALHCFHNAACLLLRAMPPEAFPWARLLFALSGAAATAVWRGTVRELGETTLFLRKSTVSPKPPSAKRQKIDSGQIDRS